MRKFLPLSLFVMLSACSQPGRFEQQLEKKIVGHLDMLPELDEALTELETEIARLDAALFVENSVVRATSLFETDPVLSDDAADFFAPIDERIDIVVAMQLRRVSADWLGSEAASGNPLDSIDGIGVPLEPIRCTRISALRWQFVPEARNFSSSNRLTFNERDGDDGSGLFGNSLGDLILPNEAGRETKDDLLVVSAAFDPGLGAVNLEIKTVRESPNPPAKIPIFSQDEDGVDRFAMVSMRPSLSESTLKIRVEPGRWIPVAISEADVLFVKVLEK